MQIAGSIALIVAAGSNVPLVLVGVLLFGAGIGNATSLPPLIAQVEFVPEDVPRVVSLIVATAQAAYAFAPAAFGLIREFAPVAGGADRCRRRAAGVAAAALRAGRRSPRFCSAGAADRCAYGRTRVSGCGPSGTRCQADPSPSAKRHDWLRAFLSTSSPRSICQAVGAKRVTRASQPALSLSAK